MKEYQLHKMTLFWRAS